MKDIPSWFSQISLTFCLSGQISRGSGKIAVERTSTFSVGGTTTRGATRGPTTGPVLDWIVSPLGRHDLFALASERKCHEVTASFEKHYLP